MRQKLKAITLYVEKKIQLITAEEYFSQSQKEALEKTSSIFFMTDSSMSTRNDHVFDCLNEDLPESFFFKEVELLLLIVTLTQKKRMAVV